MHVTFSEQELYDFCWELQARRSVLRTEAKETNKKIPNLKESIRELLVLKLKDGSFNS